MTSSPPKGPLLIKVLLLSYNGIVSVMLDARRENGLKIFPDTNNKVEGATTHTTPWSVMAIAHHFSYLKAVLINVSTYPPEISSCSSRVSYTTVLPCNYLLVSLVSFSHPTNRFTFELEIFFLCHLFHDDDRKHGGRRPQQFRNSQQNRSGNVWDAVCSLNDRSCGDFVADASCWQFAKPAKKSSRSARKQHAFWFPSRKRRK